VPLSPKNRKGGQSIRSEQDPAPESRVLSTGLAVSFFVPATTVVIDEEERWADRDDEDGFAMRFESTVNPAKSAGSGGLATRVASLG
jgi:hypothetical protein